MTVAFLRRKGSGKETCEAIASKMNNIAQVVRDDKLLPVHTTSIIRWGGHKGNLIDHGGVINKKEHTSYTNDKSTFRDFLQDLAPDIVPKTFFTTDDYLESGIEKVIVRPRYHQEAKNFYYCDNPMDCLLAFNACGPNSYISEYIPKVREWRVCFMQGRVAWVAEKFPDSPGDIAWNNSEGGHFENVKWKQWKSDMLAVAHKAFVFSGLDFGGVDVITDKDGKHYVLEINSCMKITSDYRQSCMAKVFDYMVDNGHASISLNMEKNSWGRYIHPALINNIPVEEVVPMEQAPKNPLEEWI